MSKLIYFMPGSLDGYIADGSEGFEWSAPDDDVMALINDLHRPIGTYLYGRKNYEVMTVWQTPDVMPGLSAASMDFGRIWQAADKVVYSKSLENVSTPKTRLERDFDPQAIRDLKAQASQDLTVSGPNLAAQAFQAGLVDEIQLLIVPAIIGRGIQILPDNVNVKLELLEERGFGNSWVYLRYGTRG